MNQKKGPGANSRLVQILYLLSLVLGIAELGIISRAGEWLDYAALGILGAIYPVALLVGVATAPAIRNIRVATVVSVLLSALPVIGIGGSLLVALPPSTVFLVAVVLWPLSGLGAGILDNVQTSLGSLRKSKGRVDLVGMLAMRHLGTLGASLLTLGAVSLELPAGVQYLAVGAVLVLPALVGRAMPRSVRKSAGTSPGEAPVDKSAGTSPSGAVGTRSAWVLVPMGGFMAAAVLPVSLTWAWAEPIMRELRAEPYVATLTLLAFVASQLVSCVVSYRRSAKRSPRRLSIGGLWVAGLGVAPLVAAVLNEQTGLMSEEVARLLVLVAFALLGWGIAPLPMVVINRVAELPLKLPVRSRFSRTVLVQCLMVAGGNFAFGRFADLVSGRTAYVVAAVVCIAVLVLGVRFLLAPRTASR